MTGPVGNEAQVTVGYTVARLYRARPKWRAPTLWTVSGLLSALIILTPVFTILAFLFAPASENWSHLTDTVLIDYINNSLLLMFGVALGAGSIGVTTAWLTSMYRFPGRGFDLGTAFAAGDACVYHRLHLHRYARSQRASADRAARLV